MHTYYSKHVEIKIQVGYHYELNTGLSIEIEYASFDSFCRRIEPGAIQKSRQI